MPVAELARSETSSLNPEAYEELMAAGGKPRRAAAEAALRMSPRPRMGERVAYLHRGGRQGADERLAAGLPGCACSIPPPHPTIRTITRRSSTTGSSATALSSA